MDLERHLAPLRSSKAHFASCRSQQQTKIGRAGSVSARPTPGFQVIPRATAALIQPKAMTSSFRWCSASLAPFTLLLVLVVLLSESSFVIGGDSPSRHYARESTSFCNRPSPDLPQRENFAKRGPKTLHGLNQDYMKVVEEYVVEI